MLGLIYVFVTAKPISIRRLFMLFVLGLTSTSSVLGIFHMKDSPSRALVIATSVVLLVWSLPLVRIVHDTIRLGRLSLDALVPVSDVVRWTYGFALLVAPTLTIGCLLNPAHRLVLAAIPQLMAIAGLAVLVLHGRLDRWCQPRLTFEVRRDQPTPAAESCVPVSGRPFYSCNSHLRGLAYRRVRIATRIAYRHDRRVSDHNAHD